FRTADIPKRLVPASIALGSFTFTMTALPGTPAIQNAIPIPYYGTNVFAAPGLGIIASVIMLGGGLWWLRSRAAAARVKGEGYGQHAEASTLGTQPDQDNSAMSHMPLALAILPLFLVIAVNGLFTYVVFPSMDMSFLTDRFPNVSPAKMTGLWALIVALVVACVTLVVSRLGHWSNLKET